MNLSAESAKLGDASLGRSALDAAPPSKNELGSAWLEGGMAVLDPCGRVLSLNDELAGWFGRRAGDLAGHDFGELLGGRDGECGKNFVALWQAGGAFAKVEFAGGDRAARPWFQMETARAPAGGFVRINSRLPPLYELEESAWDEHLGSGEARRSLYVRLLRAEAQLDNWMHRWPGVIFSQRADFSFSSICERIQEWTGIGAGEWGNQPDLFWRVVHEADTDELYLQLRRFTPSSPRLTATYRIRHAHTGRITYIFEQREAIHTRSGLLLGYEGVWLDVTRQTIAEKRLSSAAWKETLAILTMGLAHDFSNIMAGIMSLSEDFQAQMPKEHPFQEGLALIRRNSMQASQLVHRILNLHHGKVGDRNYHDLNVLTGDTVEMVRKIIPRRIELKTEFHGEGLALYVDEVEFRQVLINLTLNAVDAMPGGGSLTFRTSLHATLPDTVRPHGTAPGLPAACLTVADTGVGISARHLNSIFDPFFTTKAMNKGSGLGLYNARLFVEKHGGAISVESQENQGTQFHLWLPQANFSEAERRASQPATRRHTLLVTGPAQTAEAEARNLREHGYYIVTAPSEERAAELLKSPDYQFDGVVMVVTAGTFSGATALDGLCAGRKTLKKILQIVGCNKDEMDTQMLIRADLVITADLPEPEMLAKLSETLGRQ